MQIKTTMRYHLILARMAIINKSRNNEYFPKKMEKCLHNLRTDKDMENYWAWFWLIAWWEAREVLGLRGE